MQFSNNGLYGSPTRMILDPIHGPIETFIHEMDIINHVLFQRLRHIMQTDIVNYVFMGSTHNRFQHSIGTMHIAGKIFQTISNEYLIKREYQSILRPEEIAAIQYLHWIVRVAALLHDIGHFPFSHQFEYFIEKHNKKAKNHLDKISIPVERLWHDRILDSDNKLQEALNILYPETKGHDATHEDYSIRIAYDILNTNKSEFPSASFENIFDVLCIMSNSKMDVRKMWESRGADKPNNICYHIEKYHEIFLGIKWTQKCENEDVCVNIAEKTIELLKTIISGELDADKMDYILRDGYNTGSNYGHYNKDQLFNTIRIGFEATKNKSTKKYTGIQYTIAIEEKGLGALEDFVYARYQLHKEIYNHRVISGFRIILFNAFEELLSIEEYKNKIISHLELKDFHLFTDNFIWELFNKYYVLHGDPNSYCHRLICRKKLKFIKTLVNVSQERIELEINKLSQKYGKDYQDWKSDVKFSKIDGYYEKIKVWKMNEDGRTESLVSISECTDFFGKFNHKTIYHIFEL